MAKFCQNCGAQLPHDARFCESCGTKVPEARPEKRFCSSCGRELASDALFCPGCGARAGDPARETNPQNRNRTAPVRTAQANQARQTPSVPPTPRPPAVPDYMQPGYRQRVEAARRTEKPAPKSRRGLCVFLALVMVAELCIAGFKYPGFLRKTGGGTDWITGLGSGGTGGGVYDEGSDDELTLRYTKTQLDAAPAQSLTVSPWETEADFGTVRVELDAWSLEGESDTLTFRELPELSEGEEGWSLRGYDFSLGSGQHEFPTDVTITLPREETDALAGCVWFNEETGAWEDVFFEVSGDGKSYLVYADHFSLFGVKSYRFDKTTLSLVESGGPQIDLRDGVFVEVRKKGENNRMCWPVKVDEERMWNQYHAKTEEDIKAFADSIQHVFQHSDDIAADKAYYEKLDSVQNLFGETGSYVGALLFPKEAAKFVLEGVKEEEDLVGDFLQGFDIMMTTLKILEEAKRGNYTMQEVADALPASVMNHVSDLAGIGVSVVSGMTLVPWAAALVGLTWWAGGKLYSMDTTGFGQFTDPTLETIHQYFCTLDSTEMTYGGKADAKNYFNSPRQTVPMEKPASMTEKDYAVLKKTAAKYPLSRSAAGEFKTARAWYDCAASRDKAAEAVYSGGWARAIEAILTLSADDGPQYMKTVLDEFYRSYAGAFWNLDEEIQDQICTRFWSTDKGGTLTSMEEVNGGKPVTAADRLKCTEDFVNLLKQETRPIVIDVLETMQHRSCLALLDEMKTKYLPMLNCMLTFRVTDENQPSGADFRKSLYCKDWTAINANRKYVKGEAGLRYDSPSFVTPMRFDCAKEACFLPLLPSYQAAEKAGLDVRNRKENYYPYTADFVPRPESSGSVVYRCTYFHYLMMGAPDTMIVKDVSNPSDYANAKEIRAKILVPGLAKAVSKQVTDCYGNTHTVTDHIPIRRADVKIVIPASAGGVYRFSELTDYGLYSDSGIEGEHMSVYLEEALKTMEFTLSSDGSFTGYGSALFEKNNPREEIDNSVFPDMVTLGGEEPFRPVWEESSYYDSLHVELSGTIDVKTGSGSAELTGSLSGSVSTRSGDDRGNVKSSSASFEGSFGGTTPYVMVTDSGREIIVQFMSEGEGRLSHSYSVTHSATGSESRTDTGSDGWQIVIRFKKAD